MKTIGILLFDDIELLDFAGPYEVFSVANELSGFGLFRVITLSESGKAIRSVHGMQLVPDHSIHDTPALDILVIPGGDGTKAVIKNQQLMHWILDAYKKSEITFTVCSGARIPALLGLLDNQEFTTHHGVVVDVLAIAPKAIFREKRFVDNGKMMTAAGISAGIDLSLYILGKLHGQEIMEKTISYMEYQPFSQA